MQFHSDEIVNPSANIPQGAGTLGQINHEHKIRRKFVSVKRVDQKRNKEMNKLSGVVYSLILTRC